MNYKLHGIETLIADECVKDPDQSVIFYGLGGVEATELWID